MRFSTSRLSLGLIFTVAAVANLFGSVAHAGPVSKTFKLGYVFAAYGYSGSQPFSRPSGVFYNTGDGQVYVADTGNGQIVILDSKGLAIARIPHNVQDASSEERHTVPGEPRSLVVRSNGDILVTDNKCDYVDVLDFSGRSVQKVWPGDLLGTPRSDARPGCIAIDGDGCIYVSVSGKVNGILVLTPGYELKAKIGMISGQAGGMKPVTGLWVDKDRKIYATYALGECVRIYSKDGEILHRFGQHDSGYDNFSLPSGLVTDARGDIWIADALRHVVTVFSQESLGSGIKTEVIHALGGWGSDPGYMAFPTAVAGDGASKVFVLEGKGARLQAFDVLFTDSSATVPTQGGTAGDKAKTRS